MSSVNESNISNFVQTVNTHQQNIIKSKVQLQSLGQELQSHPLSEKEKTIMKREMENLANNLDELKKELTNIKLLSSEDTLAAKVSQAFLSSDIFTLMDSTRSFIRDAEEVFSSTQQLLESQVKATFTEEMEVEPNPYALFDQFWMGNETNPQDFILLGEQLLAQHHGDPSQLEKLTKAYQCWEKGAELYEKKGDLAQALAIRARMVTELKFPNTHPLYHLEEKIDETVSKTNSTHDHGAKFGQLGTGALKRGMMTVRKRNFDGQEKLVANFHVSSYSREKLNQSLTTLKHSPEFLLNNLPKELQGNVSVREVENGYFGKIDKESNEGNYTKNLANGFVLSNAIEVQFGDIGVIRIAKDDAYRSMENRVVIEINPNQSENSLDQMQAIATMMGLGPIFGVETPEEDERKQMTLLFRTFYPKEAYQLESQQLYYEISPESLKKLIIDTKPEMNQIFETFLTEGKMEKVELTPGVSIWSVPISDILSKKGAIGLMSGFSGDPSVLVNVLTQGSLCSQERYEIGHAFGGTSARQDHLHGGAGYVFNRLITQKMVNTTQKNYIEALAEYVDGPASLVERYPLVGDYQILYDLSAVNVGAYAYEIDHYGSKSSNHYGERKNLIDFTTTLNENSIQNEVMIRERIPGAKVSKILVQNPRRKKFLIDNLRDNNLLVEKEGKEYIKGFESQDVDQLIVTGRYFKEEMWKSVS